MNTTNNQRPPLTQTEMVRYLNDELRKTGSGGQVVMTRGIESLSEMDRHLIIQAVRSFDAFSPDNDPYGEHDFGCFDVGGHRIMFKIDAYDRTLTYQSSNPADKRLTVRILTIMLASDY